MERIGLAPGSEIGGYTVVSPLGSGGMGTVYRAVDGGGSPVALKLLHPHIGADPVARERLRREVAALQRLRHPAVAAVLDAEADSTEAFIVTELVAGENLEEHVREHGPLEPGELAALADGLHEALSAVHGAGVVHRDLKPSNVLVTDDGPVLIDFGIAQAADDAGMTATGLVLGTPGYLAPELMDGDEPTAATDWWGWAALLAFAATGRAPFGSRPVDAVLARAAAGTVDVDGLGPLTSDALRGALDPDPSQRTDPEAVVAALEVAAVEGDPVDEGVEEDVPATVVLGDALASTTVVASGAGTAATVVSSNDGSTRAFAAQDVAATAALAPAAYPPGTGPWPGRVPDDAGADGSEVGGTGPEGTEPDGTEWIVDDLEHSGEPEPEGSGYERPPARRRWGSLLALGLLVVTAGALAPGWTVAVLLVLILLVRTAGSTIEAMHAHRERYGVRRSDTARAVATVPWHLLRSAVGLIPSVLVGASAMVIVVGVLWWLFGSGAWAPEGWRSGTMPEGVLAHVIVGGAILVGLIATWWGPLSSMTRTGARRVLAIVAPGRTGALVLVLVVLALVAVLLVQVLSASPIDWTPLPEPTLP